MLSESTTIEFRGVTKRFRRRVVLDRLDLRVERGETLAILGASGSGKSVTLRHIVGLIRPNSGEVLVDGVDVAGMDIEELRELRRKVALVFQNNALFDSLSVGENVAYGLRERGQLTHAEIAARVSDALDRVGLEGIEETLPASLSGGMKKRVALARSMVLDPETLLYDEPTAGLDPVTGFLVSNLIRETARDERITSVVVTHDIQSAMLIADRLALLVSGRIVFQGTPEEARVSSVPELRGFLDAYLSDTAPGSRA